MIKPELRKLIEDRLSIKATQKLKRYISIPELSQFFMRNRGKVENAHKDYIKSLDKIINEYLEGIE